MANGFLQDPVGLNRLAQQIRLNRQEGLQREQFERGLETQGLQDQLLRGQVKQQQMGLGDLVRQQQQRQNILGKIQASPDQDPDRVTFEFLKENDPGKAQEFGKNILSAAGQIAKYNPKEAVDFINTKTGSNITYAGADLETGFEKLDTGDKIMFLDPNNNFEVVKEFQKGA